MRGADAHEYNLIGKSSLASDLLVSKPLYVIIEMGPRKKGKKSDHISLPEREQSCRQEAPSIVSGSER